ncbi:iron-containing alcohol dehydrogenase [Achromobacter xylosoxidans]|uniref:Iron-containing alcohol dehydrogenase n=1 Tax=Alcaligenes xylosoxydans xylosoxydans TaxID=85698 RepID=A0A9X3L4C4_ALCXX|nr:iron-containing alcohol dehydrogenase [Achromobacter xylosoxidans]MCZ8405359.1 iron-containing alcohol dehydrogenase [Achromobacter xylosoxidans]
MTFPGLRYRFNGHERVLHDARADEALPELMNTFGYRRAFIVCSRSLNTGSTVIRDLEAALGEHWVGTTDRVGEHSPLSNVLHAARQAFECRADVLVSVGGGSVMDMCKAMQLCISEQAFEREQVLTLQMHMSADHTEMLAGSNAPPRIRQIAVPTTLATSEWTPVSTPVDDLTHQKARFLVPDGGPCGIIYDPVLLARTPPSLLLSTGIRGLDHAINTACSLHPHPLASLLAEKAIQLFVENLPRLRKSDDREAFTHAQLATWYTGMGQMSVPHGFSHWMVHVVGPLGGVPHSDAACVLMLAQARWLADCAGERHARVLRLLGRVGPFADVLDDLLKQLGLPRTLADLGLTDAQIESFIAPALAHPQITKNNLRPIATEADVRAVLALARGR